MRATAKSFNEMSYLSQVRQLRHLAAEALRKYPIQATHIHFIHHGENTTFRIDGRGSRKYLLRIHRNDYHTKNAIQEEMAWLALLSARGITVPKPVVSKQGQFVETASHTQMPEPRHCSVFEWIEGRFIDKSVSPKHMYQVGIVLAELQSHTPRKPVRHRRYWTADGIVGDKPKFGSIDSLVGVRPMHQSIITRARKTAYQKLRRFERQFPKRMGLIHADLHFGNLLSVGPKLGAIDFDDCGYGFHAYDLVIPLISARGILGDKTEAKLPALRDALFSGYTTKRNWDRDDEKIFPYLITARRLTLLGWLNSRSDNPRLRKHLKGAVERTIDHIHSQRNSK